jgi:cyclic-di-GMP phosphodiesterase TipF (flagellum assembly factor)
LSDKTEPFDIEKWMAQPKEEPAESDILEQHKLPVKTVKPLRAKPPKAPKTKKATPAPKADKSTPQQKIWVGAAFAITALGLYAITNKMASFDFVLLVAGMIGLGAIILNDQVTRRKWENDVSSRVEKLLLNHDRLVREVARNRNDIAMMKEGMAEIAMDIETQGRQLGASATSPEAQMIGTIVEHLSDMGESPRAEMRARKDSDKILELEMAPPPIGDLPQSELDSELQPIENELSEEDIQIIIKHALREDDIHMFLQPVVGLPQRRTKFFEVFARVQMHGGRILPASGYMNVAKSSGLMPAIDTALLVHVLDFMREDNITCYIVNITRETLQDRTFMGELISFLSDNADNAHRLIFEMRQAEFEQLDDTQNKIMDNLCALGCQFAMDRIRRRQFHIEDLRSRNIRYLKVDADWLIKEGQSKGGFSRIARLKKELDASGIDLIVERVESETQLRELLDYNIDYGQGHLFGKPESYLAYHLSSKGGA